jgi:hypothetical protein
VPPRRCTPRAAATGTAGLACCCCAGCRCRRVLRRPWRLLLQRGGGPCRAAAAEVPVSRTVAGSCQRRWLLACCLVAGRAWRQLGLHVRARVAVSSGGAVERCPHAAGYPTHPPSSWHVTAHAPAGHQQQLNAQARSAAAAAWRGVNTWRGAASAFKEWLCAVCVT